MPINYQVQELRFGHVRELDGHSVTILADTLECQAREVEYAVELGSFVNPAAPKSDLIAVVSGIKVVETPNAGNSGKSFEDRKLVIATLVGFLRNGTTFERGIERYPIIGTEAYLLTEQAMASMFEKVVEGGIPIGIRCQRGGGTEFARVDRLFGRHTAVLGTTGSGKSWAVASLLQNAMQVMPHTRLLFLDLHDEYRSAFPADFQRLNRKVHHISSQALKLPYWCLNADELEELFVSKEHTAQNQSALFKSEIRELRAKQAETLRL